MNTYRIYKGIKQRLNGIAPLFFYLGQYLKGKDNTSYVVPAVYIEMPKNLSTLFFGKLKVAKDAEVKIHLVTHAPYKNHDNPIQDSLLQDHQTKLDAVDQLLCGWILKDEDSRMLTQQFIPIGANVQNFNGTMLYSVLTYRTEFISRSL